MKKKILSCFLAGAMVLSLAACGGKTNEPASNDGSTTPAEGQDNTVADEAASIDFEDGNMGFVEAYMQKGDAGQVELSIVDYNGSKALQVKNVDEKVPYVAFDATSLLGADVAKVASVEMTVGVSYDDGSFNAVAGDLIAWSGEDLIESTDPWSVYMENQNPKKAVMTLGEGEEFVADAGNIFMINLKTDNGLTDGKGAATLYIDNIRFLDAAGNLLTADSSVAFAAPAGFEGSTGVDPNLFIVSGAVEFAGFACTGDAWSQNGFDIPEDVLAALVPGSVVELSYTSESGDLWLVMPDSAAGWMRVGVGNADGSGSADAICSNGVCQVTYEQLAAVLGEDTSTWGARMQAESDTAWEVFSVKVGQGASVLSTSNPVEFAGFACSGDAWSQNGFDFTEEVLAALVPGTALELSYTSESGDLWTVFPDSAAGWMRVGVGNADGSGSADATCYDGKCYVPYDMIVAALGEDSSAWGGRLQAESDTAWEVYSVNVVTATPMTPAGNYVAFEGAACSGDAWSQNGADITEEVLAALVPGSVVTINYTSESGDLWIVMPDSAAGWMRVGVGNADGSGSADAACLNGTCQVTYDMLAAVLGEDTSTWGGRMQFESDTAWEVYSVSVGRAAR